MRNRLRLLLGAAVAIGAVAGGIVLWTSQPADAADHNDPPGAGVGGVSDNLAADIDDVYAWHEGANLNVIVTYSGPTAPTTAAGTEGVYSRDTQFLIHISNDADLDDEHTIQVRFGQSGARWGFQASGIPGRTTPLVGPVESLMRDGAVKAYVGLRDDPFFFDLDGFKATATSGTLAFMATRDFFAGKNTTAIALQFPTAPAAMGGTGDLRVWVSSGVSP